MNIILSYLDSYAEKKKIQNLLINIHAKIHLLFYDYSASQIPIESVRFCMVRTELHRNNFTIFQLRMPVV